MIPDYIYDLDSNHAPCIPTQSPDEVDYDANQEGNCNDCTTMEHESIFQKTEESDDCPQYEPWNEQQHLHNEEERLERKQKNLCNQAQHEVCLPRLDCIQERVASLLVHFDLFLRLPLLTGIVFLCLLLASFAAIAITVLEFSSTPLTFHLRTSFTLIPIAFSNPAKAGIHSSYEKPGHDG